MADKICRVNVLCHCSGGTATARAKLERAIGEDMVQTAAAK